jgi:hypothetical protein
VPIRESRARYGRFERGEEGAADLQLDVPQGRGQPVGDLFTHHDDNLGRHEAIWNREPGNASWRDWRASFYGLGKLKNMGAPHDPYRLLSLSILSGNRHALPHLVDLLQKRDNPVGWFSGWGKLAKAMEDRVGDLPYADTYRRAAAIALHSGQHSADPKGHHELAAAASAAGGPYHADNPDLTGFAALADHMDEHNLPQYAQLLRAELANQLPALRKTPRRKNSRL